MMTAYLEKAPDRSQEADVCVSLRRFAIQAVARGNQFLPLKEALLGLQQWQNALVLGLFVPDGQPPGSPTSSQQLSGMHLRVDM